MLHLINRNKIIVNENNFIGGVGAFNPNFDGNALAWYDGNVGLIAGGWQDQSTGSHNIVFTNTPTIVPNATPLRDAVRFDGINQYGQVATPATITPYSIYIVVSQLTWTNLDRIYEDGTGLGKKMMFQSIVSPNIEIFNNAGGTIQSNPDLALATFGVMTAIFNGANSELRTNLNASVIGVLNSTNGNGITLAARTNFTSLGNIEVAYLIIRSGADSTAIQNKLINGLKAACGLTF